MNGNQKTDDASTSAERAGSRRPSEIGHTASAGQMIDEGLLRLKAREAIQAGKLPNRRAERMWGGPGFGADCGVCGRPVQVEELGFELDFAGDEEAPDQSNYHVHIRCFAAWEFALQNGATTHTGKPVGAGILPAASGDGTISTCERDTTYKPGPVR